MPKRNASKTAMLAQEPRGNASEDCDNSPMSLENLLRMRPTGLASKKEMGASRTHENISLCRRCDDLSAVKGGGGNRRK